jgi:RNase adapter protein RapZ
MTSHEPSSTGAPPKPQRLVLVTGPAGAGRGTAIKVLEDIGFEAIDNLPLTLLPRLLEGPPLARPIALGIDPRNRDFTTDAFLDLVRRLAGRPDLSAEVLYLDCREDVLLRRFSETRRRHPLAPDESPEIGITREADMLGPLRGSADHVVDTTDLSPHDLKDELLRWYSTAGDGGLSLSVQSFSYKRGIPAGVDMVLDVRFLRNPHWDAALRPLDGRNPAVAAHVAGDPRFAPFLEQLSRLVDFLLPAYEAEGKTHFSLAFGCTGGRHRSVALAENLAEMLANKGWQVSIRHRELERQAGLVLPRPIGVGPQ